MPLSLADLQSSLLGSCAGQVGVALRDAAGNPPAPSVITSFLNWPICDAILQLGGTVGSPSAVADVDLATLPDLYIPRLLAVSRLQVKRAIRGQLALVTQSVGSNTRALSDLAKQLDREIMDLERDIRSRFGLTPVPPSFGKMRSAKDIGMGGLFPEERRLRFGEPFRYEGGFEFP